MAIKIVFTWRVYSCVYTAHEEDRCWRGRDYSQYFKSLDGHIPLKIEIGKGTIYWQMAYCHELAHIYLYPKEQVIIRRHHQGMKAKTELLAWQIAKSFCKRKYWHEEFALQCLNTYRKPPMQPYKSRIRAINKGIKLR